ncbi:hypothetical protein FRC04_006831 [Tulasnella sp. 424]|nr:hypothetical protein FRC04_006831 [Tulasnella sp. 424]
MPMRSYDLLRPPSDSLTPLQPQLTGSSTYSSEGYISDVDAPEAEEIIDAHTIQLESKPFAFGGCADVYRGTWKPSWSKTNVSVAVKVLRFSGMSKEGNQDYPKQMAKIDRVRAANLHKGVSFDHLLRAMPTGPPAARPGDVGLAKGSSPQYYTTPGLHAENGNMNVYLSKHSNADVLALLHQAAGGLNFLHTFEPFPIAHLDIKGENILINDAEEASICDFGVSRMMDELSTGFTTSNPVLTLSFAPPEILNGGKGDTTADAFSFGGLMLQALSGKAPYYKWRKIPARITLAVMGGSQPQPADHPITRLSPRAVNEAWALMKRCWNKERSDRPTLQNIMDTIEDIKVLDLQSSQDVQ